MRSAVKQVGDELWQTDRQTHLTVHCVTEHNRKIYITLDAIHYLDIFFFYFIRLTFWSPFPVSSSLAFPIFSLWVSALRYSQFLIFPVTDVCTNIGTYFEIIKFNINLVVTICTTTFNNKTFYILLTQCVYSKLSIIWHNGGGSWKCRWDSSASLSAASPVAWLICRCEFGKANNRMRAIF